MKYLLIGLLSFLLISCEPAKPAATPKFQVGDLVVTVVGNHEAQILSTHCRSSHLHNDACYYVVRVNVMSEDGMPEQFFDEIELKSNEDS